MDVYFWVESSRIYHSYVPPSCSWGDEKNSLFSLSKHSSSCLPYEHWTVVWVLTGFSFIFFYGSALQTLPRFRHFQHLSKWGGEEIICKNRFNFKFIFRSQPSSPCVLYWFWYYRYHSSNDDVFSSSSPPPSCFRLCVLKWKYFRSNVSLEMSVMKESSRFWKIVFWEILVKFFLFKNNFKN